MPSNWFEILACVAIIGFMIYAIFRGGTANPVGTGQLQRQMNTIGSKIGEIETALKGCASTAEVFAVREQTQSVRSEMKAMEERVASSGELLVLEGKLNVIAEKVNGWGRATERTESIVQRIEGHFLRRGIDRD